MFGNSGRSPMFHFEKVPYYEDFEEVLKFHRQFDYRVHEFLILHPTRLFSNPYHPQREDADDMTIADAEFQADVNKRLEEQRHEMAIKCVQFGIYKDIF